MSETATTTAPTPPLIDGKMISVLQDIGAVGKWGDNQAQKYRFRSIDDVYNAVHPLFARHGIYCAPEVVKETREIRHTAKGGEMASVVLHVRHRFYAADGSYRDVTTVGEAMDSGDKASNKAMTAAFKYALTQAFTIPFEQIDDADAHSPQPAPRGQLADRYGDNAQPPAQAKPSQPQAANLPFQPCPLCGKVTLLPSRHGPGFWCSTNAGGCGGRPAHAGPAAPAQAARAPAPKPAPTPAPVPAPVPAAATNPTPAPAQAKSAEPATAPTAMSPSDQQFVLIDELLQVVELPPERIVAPFGLKRLEELTAEQASVVVKTLEIMIAAKRVQPSKWQDYCAGVAKKHGRQKMQEVPLAALTKELDLLKTISRGAA